MYNFQKHLIALLWLFSVAISGTSFAKGPSKKVVATYKNREVTEDQVSDFYNDILTESGNLQAKEFSELQKENKQGLIREYIKILVIEEEAKASKISKSSNYQRKWARCSSMFLIESFLEQSVKNSVTDQLVEDEYQHIIKNLQDKGECKVHYARFKNELDGKKAVQALKAGTSFANAIAPFIGKTAYQHSDQKYIRPGTLFPEIEAAMFKLDVNQSSELISGPSGYYIIKVLDKRKIKQLPSFAELKSHITDTISEEHKEKIIKSFVESANVRIFTQ